jgi:Cu/Zn superoxide dismutase
VRKFLVFVLILAMTATLIALAGCGKKTTTIKTPEGDVTVTGEKGGEVTLHGEEGDVTYKSSEGEPTEEELGVPVYPDADYVPGSGSTASAGSEQGGLAVAGAEYTTKDDYDEVVSWYKQKLGKPFMESTENGKETTWMNASEQLTTTVTVAYEDGEVKIKISKISGVVTP